jgi:hypothetical protein
MNVLLPALNSPTMATARGASAGSTAPRCGWSCRGRGAFVRGCGAGRGEQASRLSPWESNGRGCRDESRRPKVLRGRLRQPEARRAARSRHSGRRSVRVWEFSERRPPRGLGWFREMPTRHGRGRQDRGLPGQHRGAAAPRLCPRPTAPREGPFALRRDGLRLVQRPLSIGPRTLLAGLRARS